MRARIKSGVRRHLTPDRAQASFDRAKQAVYRAACVAGGETLAHRLSARWLAWLCGQAWAQRLIWPHEVHFLRRFLAESGVLFASPRDFIQRSLMGELWRAWRLLPLLEAPPELLARVLKVVGWEQFERCRQDPRGLILAHYHGQFARLFVPLLRDRGTDGGVSVGEHPNRLIRRGLTGEKAQMFEMARQLQAAKQALAQGRLVHSPADAFANLSRAREVPFFNRSRRIATGFAKLACHTNARVMPLAVHFCLDGTFVLEFAAPFNVPPSLPSRESQVACLVDQYTEFLREQWTRYPWNLQWGYLAMHLDLPAAPVSRALA